MSNYILCTKYFLVSLFILASIGLGSNAETVEMESHGGCVVATERDDFTDKISTHFLMCKGQSISDSYGDYDFGAACSNKKTVLVRLEAGIQFHLEDYIQVKYRFGKDRAETTRWEWSSSSGAVTRFRGTHDAMVNRLGNVKKGEKFIFQVGDEKGVIKFTGKEREAAIQYLKRCANFL